MGFLVIVVCLLDSSSFQVSKPHDVPLRTCSVCLICHSTKTNSPNIGFSWLEKNSVGAVLTSTVIFSWLENVQAQVLRPSWHTAHLKAMSSLVSSTLMSWIWARTVTSVAKSTKHSSTNCRTSNVPWGRCRT